MSQYMLERTQKYMVLFGFDFVSFVFEDRFHFLVVSEYCPWRSRVLFLFLICDVGEELGPAIRLVSIFGTWTCVRKHHVGQVTK